MAEPPVEFKPNIDDPEIAQPHIVEPPEAVKVNTANYFFTSEKYKVRDDLIEWCKREAEKVGFTIVIEKSDNGSNRRKKFFILIKVTKKYV
jgi:hypothetical protein